MGKLTNGKKKSTREEHRAHATRPMRRRGYYQPVRKGWTAGFIRKRLETGLPY